MMTSSTSSSKETLSAAVDDDDDQADISSHFCGSLSLQFDDDSVNSSHRHQQLQPPPSSSTLLLPSPSMSQNKEIKQVRWSDDTIDSPGSKKSQYRVTFEIVSAKTVNRSSSRTKKYVSYSILVKRVPGLETQPGVVERRYTDFLQLYQSLRKRFPSLLNEFPFPKKTLVGNFTPEVITERSVAFQQLLVYCLSIRELRTTREFHDFLFSRELKEALRLMRCAQFEEASNLFENVFFIQEKLTMVHGCEPNTQMFKLLCHIVACFNAVNNTTEAQKYAERAFELLSSAPSSPSVGSKDSDNNELAVPFIVLSIRLWLAIGSDPTDLKAKLHQFKQKGVNVDRQPTLLELILRKDLI